MATLSVAAGEYGYDARYFRRMLAADAVDVLQADATRCGGVSGFLQAAALCDAGRRPYTTEAAMAKLFASEAACRAAGHGVQIHGGYGFTREFLVERIYRDVKLCTIGEGTSEIQRLVIARDLLKA